MVKRILASILLVLPALAGAQNFGLGPVQSQAPLDYVQSGFMLGLQRGGFPVLAGGDVPTKAAAVSKMAAKFEGSEILLNDLRTPQAMADIQLGNKAIKTVSESKDPSVNPRGKPFYGYYVVSRPLGFFWPGEIPTAYQSNGLKSDGSVHYERSASDPTQIDGSGSISISGWTFDITNQAAVSLFLQKNSQAFRTSCSQTPTDFCTGPLYGYVAFNETSLSGNYGDFLNGPAYSDQAPADYTQTDNHLRYPRLGDPAAGQAQSYWMLDAMLSGQALPNGDSYLSYLHGPKRMMPLFTPAARDSFVAYARAKNPARADIDRLPADRWEFNYDASTLQLNDPSPLGPNGWVKFVALSDTEYWGLWEDWVYGTWGNFINAWAKSFADAQAGNPDYKGSIYFDFPGWWSIRKAAANQPVTYSYLDTNTGALVTKTGTVAGSAPLASDGKSTYKTFNNVTRAMDLSLFASSPYFAGFVHETTNEIPGGKPNLPREQLEDAIYNSDMHHYLFMLMGQAAKDILHANGKIFGAFVRWGTIGFPNDQPGLMSEALFNKVNFDRVIRVLKPDMISTIPPGIYFQNSEAPPGQMGCGSGVCYGTDWIADLTNYDALYHGATPPATGTIIVTSGVDGADILLAAPNAISRTWTGQTTKAGGTSLLLTPGTYCVELVKDGYLEINAGSCQTLKAGDTLTVSGTPVPAPTSMGPIAFFPPPLAAAALKGTVSMVAHVYDSSGKGIKQVPASLVRRGATGVGILGDIGNLQQSSQDPHQYQLSWDTTKLANGTPVPDGTYSVWLIPVDNTGVRAAFALDVTIANGAVAGVPAITSAGSANGTVGAAFSYQITATNNPTSFNATGLPAGLSVNANTGLISGTPAAVGTANVAISATNAGGTGTATLVLTVTPAGSSGGITLDSPASGASVASPVSVSGSYPCDASIAVTFFNWPAGNPLAFHSANAILDKNCTTHNGHANTYGWSYSWTTAGGSYVVQAQYGVGSGQATAAIPVTVAAAGPPIALTSPKNGDALTGTATVAGHVDMGQPLQSVDLSIDGQTPFASLPKCAP